jgi:hypothetical protein
MEKSPKYSLKGLNVHGIEVYETSDEILQLSSRDRKSKYLDIMKNEYRGRTAKFIRNGHTYYARFDPKSIRKTIYGDDRSSKDGVKAIIKTGAEGDIFELVEKSKYEGSAPNIKNHTNADYFDYFIKTVQIDNKVFELKADVEKKYGIDGGYVYTLSLKDNNKIKASPAHDPPKKVSVKVAGNASNSNISQKEQSVNRENEGISKNGKVFL